MKKPGNQEIDGYVTEKQDYRCPMNCIQKNRWKHIPKQLTGISDFHTKQAAKENTNTKYAVTNDSESKFI
jgi:hypothetical protein